MLKYDTEVDKIKRYLSTGKPSDFSLDKEGALFFKNRLVVPKFKEYARESYERSASYASVNSPWQHQNVS